MTIKVQYKEAYRFLRIVKQGDDTCFWTSTTFQKLNIIAIGNAARSLAMSYEQDSYAHPFKYRNRQATYNVVTMKWENRDIDEPKLDDIPF